jgi:hypothetical protein
MYVRFRPNNFQEKYDKVRTHTCFPKKAMRASNLLEPTDKDGGWIDCYAHLPKYLKLRKVHNTFVSPNLPRKAV